MHETSIVDFNAARNPTFEPPFRPFRCALTACITSLRKAGLRQDLRGIAATLGMCYLTISELVLSSGLRNFFPRVLEEVYRSLVSRTSSTQQEARSALKVWEKNF